MVHNLRHVLLGIILLFCSYMSYRMYLYFFDTTPPQVSLVNVEEGKSYAGDLDITLKGSSSYKVAYADILLDDQVFEKNVPLYKKRFDYPLHISAQNLSDGPHKLTIDVVDSTKHKNKTSLERTFYTDNATLQAAFASTGHDHKVVQGRCLHVKVQVNKPTAQATVKALSGSYNCFPKNKNSLVYEAFVPVECEQVAQEYPFTVEVKDKVGNKLLLDNVLQVQAGDFKRKILHVQSNRLKSELEYTSLQEKDLEEALEKITQNSVKEKLWTGSFDVPILKTGVSTEFGVIRTSQERGRTIHKALDLVAEPKSVIWASQNGIVVLKDRFTHSGNTVVIDHGNGVISMYFHLHDFADIEVGQKVKKGNPLGRMGMTGFANGQHLHWEIRVNNTAVDPMQWTQLTE